MGTSSTTMKGMDRSEHWENVYKRTPYKELGWYQPKPETSLSLFAELQLPPDARIIDVGGGSSTLVDHLLDMGFSDVTVLDISATAMQTAQDRLGNRAKGVTWILQDVMLWRPSSEFDVWHDRATFHFFHDPEDIQAYVRVAAQVVRHNGYLVIGAFSHNGPTMCSGLPVTQYSDEKLQELLKNAFSRVKCIEIEHATPSGIAQEYIFCVFQRNAPA